MNAEQLIARFERAGGRLYRLRGRIRYVGPELALTPEIRGSIAAHRERLLQGIPDASIADLMAHLADRGIWLVLRDGRIELRCHDHADPEGVDEDIVREIEDRHVEVAAWLARPLSQLQDAELDAFGYTREGVERFEADLQEPRAAQSH